MLSDAKKMLATLFATVTGGFIELRPIQRGGVARPTFFPVSQTEQAADRAIELREWGDVYVGVAPRVERASSKAAVAQVQALWADLDPDSPGALIDVLAFTLQPSIVVHSGRGHHFYWLLETSTDVATAESLNRALALRLGTDPRVVNADRLLRVPGTINHKDGSAVRLLRCSDARYSVETLRAELGSPRPEGASTAQAADDGEGATFERFLSRVEVASRSGRSARAHCPAHDDAHPSLSIKEGDDGRVLVKCHADCSPEAIVEAAGLSWSDMFAATDAVPVEGRLARIVVGLADREGMELFHNPQQDAFASFRVGARDGVPEHYETHRLDSRACELWLRSLYYRHRDDALSDTAIKEAVGLLQARALFDGPRRETHHRLAGDLERIYIDLGDPAWQVVEVTGRGWEILERSPVAFVRDPAALPLPLPEHGGSVDDLRPLTNFAGDTDWVIFRGALLSYFHPTGPYLLLALLGPEGTAKTTTAKYFFGRLTDPMVGAFPVGTPRPRDIAVAARTSRLVGFDNVGTISRPLSDLLCQLISGGGIRERKLYTNSDIVADEIKTLVVLTARTQVMKEADLIDRAAVARLRPLMEHERREEAELLADLTKIAGKVLGGILDAVSGALREYGTTRPPGLPRLADVTRFVTAAEAAMGWEPGSFQTALAAAQGDSLVESIESSLYAATAVLFMSDRDQWSGTSSELLASLSALDEAGAKHRDWPKTPAAASAELDRNSQVLQAHGIAYSRRRQPGGSRHRIVTLTRIADAGRDCGTEGRTGTKGS